MKINYFICVAVISYFLITSLNFDNNLIIKRKLNILQFHVF